MFVFAVWLVSRVVIVVVMQLIAPLLPASVMQRRDRNSVATIGWQSFAHWDGNWDRTIVTSGYEFALDVKQHNIAFFPLFPLVTRAVITLGLPFEVAGTVVNNLYISLCALLGDCG